MAEVINVQNISKQYRLGQVGTGTISHDLNRWWHMVRGKEDPYLKIGEINDRTQKEGAEYVWALQDINFNVKQGEVLGIIGRNGAGKSTLLKILSRTTAPSKGKITIKGRVASLLEVGTGFHPELSGRENISLNGAILGMTRHEISRKFDQIVDFAGVERYIDTPVKRYSSGMYVRLAFAVAAHLDPEILVVDEVLAVGDAEFQKKALGKMKDASNIEGRTVLFVSHNMAAVKALCTRGLVLKNGMLDFAGTHLDAVQHYQNLKNSISSFKHAGSLEEAPGNDKVRILLFDTLTEIGEIVTMNSGINFKLDFYCSLENKNIDVTFEISNNDDLVIFHKGTIITSNNDSKKGVYTIICKLPRQLLNAGLYNVKLIIGEGQRYILYMNDSICSFEVVQEVTGSNSSVLPGIIFPDLKFDIIKPE